MIRLLALLSLLIAGFSIQAGGAAPHHPGLSREDWYCAISTSKAIQVTLTNEGLIDQNKVDNDKTEIILLAKEQLPRAETRQVFFITLHESTGRSVSFVAQSKTAGAPGAPKSDYECPADDPRAYVISKVL